MSSLNGWRAQLDQLLHAVVRVGLVGAEHRLGVALGLEQPGHVHRVEVVDDQRTRFQTEVVVEPGRDLGDLLPPVLAAACAVPQCAEVLDLVLGSVQPQQGFEVADRREVPAALVVPDRRPLHGQPLGCFPLVQTGALPQVRQADPERAAQQDRAGRQER